MKIKIKQSSLYFIYFLGALIFFSIVAFPGQEAAKILTAWFDNAFTDVQIETDKVSPLFPAGLTVKESRLTYHDNFHVSPDKLAMNFSLSTIFKPVKNISFKGAVNQGEVEGEIKGASFSKDSFANLKMNFSNVKVNDYIYKTPAFKLGLTFDASGDLEIMKDRNKTAGKAVLLNFSADIHEGTALKQLGTPAIEFTRVDITYTTVKNEIIISKCVARGSLLNLEIQGKVKLAGNSLMVLKGHIKPSPSFVSGIEKASSIKRLFKNPKGKGIPVTITGSLKNPKMRFR